MYVRTGNPGKRRMAGAHRLSGLRGAQRIVLGDDTVYGPIDPGYEAPDYPTYSPAPVIAPSSPLLSPTTASLLSTLIQTGGAVAARAVTPPTYSSSINPLTGQQTITSYAPIGSTAASSLLGASSLLSSPLIWLVGIGAIAFVAMKR